MNLLTLLKKGCKVTFPGDYYLLGLPGSGYIQVGTQFGAEGQWDLSAEGLKSALADVKQMERKDKERSRTGNW